MAKEVTKLKEALNSLSQLSYSTSSSKRQSQQLEALQHQVKQLQNQLTVSGPVLLLHWGGGPDDSNRKMRRLKACGTCMISWLRTSVSATRCKEQLVKFPAYGGSCVSLGRNQKSSGWRLLVASHTGFALLDFTAAVFPSRATELFVS